MTSVDTHAIDTIDAFENLVNTGVMLKNYTRLLPLP